MCMLAGRLPSLRTSLLSEGLAAPGGTTSPTQTQDTDSLRVQPSEASSITTQAEIQPYLNLTPVPLEQSVPASAAAVLEQQQQQQRHQQQGKGSRAASDASAKLLPPLPHTPEPPERREHQGNGSITAESSSAAEDAGPAQDPASSRSTPAGPGPQSQHPSSTSAEAQTQTSPLRPSPSVAVAARQSVRR